MRQLNDGTGPIPQKLPLYFSTVPASSSMRPHEIWKFGASLGNVVKGRFEDLLFAEYLIEGKLYKNSFTVRHEDGNQTFVLPGDSGSIMALLGQVDGKRAFIAIGILYATIAGQSEIAIGCNMSHVLSALNRYNIQSVPPTMLVEPDDLTVGSWRVV